MLQSAKILIVTLALLALFVEIGSVDDNDKYDIFSMCAFRYQNKQKNSLRRFSVFNRDKFRKCLYDEIGKFKREVEYWSEND